ncbi:adenosine deaminase, partial [Mesorhizobium sp. M7D.F.Ca.US.004.01.2.1]
GVPVSINTDDPTLLDTTLEASYAACAEAFGWDGETIRELAATSVQASYADPALKARILTDLAAWRS